MLFKNVYRVVLECPSCFSGIFVELLRVTSIYCVVKGCLLCCSGMCIVLSKMSVVLFRDKYRVLRDVCCVS